MCTVVLGIVVRRASRRANILIGWILIVSKRRMWIGKTFVDFVMREDSCCVCGVKRVIVCGGMVAILQRRVWVG